MYRIEFEVDRDGTRMDAGDLYQTKAEARQAAQEFHPAFAGLRYFVRKVPERAVATRRPNREFLPA